MSPQSKMKKILFVCHGNICRSPMAEMVLKEMVRQRGLEDHYEIASAATSTEEIGNDIYPPAKDCLRRHGIPFTRRGARQITRRDYDYYDRIILMDQNNLRYLRWSLPDVHRDPLGKLEMLMEIAGDSRDVADPWYTGNFEATYRDVVEGCTALLEADKALNDN